MSKPKPLLFTYQYSLIPMALLFMAGALAASGLALPALFWWSWLAVVLAGTVAVVMRSNQVTASRCSVWLFCFLLGGSYFTGFQFAPGENDIAHWANKPQSEMTATLLGRYKADNRWIIAVKTLDEQPVSGQAVLRFLPSAKVPVDMTIGSRIKVNGRLTHPFTARFPGGFDYRQYLHQHRITALVQAKQVQVIESQAATPWLQIIRFTDTVRSRIAGHFKNSLPSPEAEIWAGIVLGEHAVGLDQAVKSNFIGAGLIHILAASGLNVGLIGAFFLFLGKWLRFPQRVTLVMAMAGVGFYCMLTGLPPSVQRAGLMLELALVLKFINRELTPLMLLCLVGALLVVIDPMVITMLGFQLSFISTFGLMVMVGPLQEKLGFYLTSWGAGLLLVPLVAQLWVTPVLLLHFNHVQLVALPANLLALPLVVVLSYAGFVLGALSLAIPQITGPVLHMLGLICTALRQVAEFWSQVSFAVWHVPSPPVTGILMLLGLLVLSGFVLHHPGILRLKPLVLSVMVLLLGVFLPGAVVKWQQPQQVRITWIPQWETQGVQVIRLPDNAVIVNVNQLSTYGARDVAAYLRQQGMFRIQMVNLVSPRFKSIEGIASLFQAIPVEQIVTPKLASAKVQDRLITLTREAGVAMFPVLSTHQVESPSVTAEFFAVSPAETLQRYTVGSMCMALHWGPTALSQSPLQEAAKGCLFVQDHSLNQPPTVRTPAQTSAPIVLNRFKEFLLPL